MYIWISGVVVLLQQIKVNIPMKEDIHSEFDLEKVSQSSHASESRSLVSQCLSHKILCVHIEPTRPSISAHWDVTKSARRCCGVMSSEITHFALNVIKPTMPACIFCYVYWDKARWDWNFLCLTNVLPAVEIIKNTSICVWVTSLDTNEERVCYARIHVPMNIMVFFTTCEQVYAAAGAFIFVSECLTQPGWWKHLSMKNIPPMHRTQKRHMHHTTHRTHR